MASDVEGFTVSAVLSLLQSRLLRPVFVTLGIALLVQVLVAVALTGDASGGAAMIRSLAVRQSARKYGFGERLVHWDVERARDAGACRVVLLTETAPRFFARLGFAAVERSSLPQALLESSSVAPA